MWFLVLSPVVGTILGIYLALSDCHRKKKEEELRAIQRYKAAKEAESVRLREEENSRERRPLYEYDEEQNLHDFIDSIREISDYYANGADIDECAERFDDAVDDLLTSSLEWDDREKIVNYGLMNIGFFDSELKKELRERVK